ncbi:hypothetical protein Glove_350g127 [Diversispora epigaea]|uniref:Uncharacterized protein n=1 Tax=Diversispora epigaea TaxID=1348612 RepID=A0A397HG35_9GLOM|nr:hypothetical protein Glove_350g127 [Diversispora epigaea]
MSQESRTLRIHIKRRVELSSLQNEPFSAHNEPESSKTSKKSVDISSLKEKYNICLPRSYKEQTSAPQTIHFSEELESTILNIWDLRFGISAKNTNYNLGFGIWDLGFWHLGFWHLDFEFGRQIGVVSVPNIINHVFECIHLDESIYGKKNFSQFSWFM